MAHRDAVFDEALTRLARYDRRNTMMLRRMRTLAWFVALAVIVGGGGLGYAVWANSGRITDLQRTRAAAIIYTCRQTNQEHVRTLVFLDKTELQQLHKRVGPQRYPAIERRTLAVLHHLPKTQRATALSTHRLLWSFIDNLAPYQDCPLRARALSSGQTQPR